MIKSFIASYIKLEELSGILLILFATLAIFFANTTYLSPTYNTLQNIFIGVTIADFTFQRSLLSWVNDGLMTLFFFLVTLEIKREIIDGELSTIKRAILPIVGAIGGMIVPACIFMLFNLDTPENLKGWAIPMATDITFALSILMVLGRRVPLPLKIFVTTLAIVDDLGAIVVLATFYTNTIHFEAMFVAIGLTIIAFILGHRRITFGGAYVVIGMLLWFSLLKSGVHPTLSGVLLGFAIPHQDAKGECEFSRRLEKKLHSWVNLCIVPFFVFLNVGVPLANSVKHIFDPLTIAITLGLFFGKQIGIFSFVFIAIKTNLAHLPRKVSLSQIYGISVLSGIGFTMSLFIADAAFSNIEKMNAVRLGIIYASSLSIVWGLIILYFAAGAKNSA